jgi:hypothetical protein
MRFSRGMGAISKEKIRSIKKRDGNQPVKVFKAGVRVKRFEKGGETKSDLSYLLDPKETLKDIGYTIGEGLFGGDPDPNPPGTPVEERDEGIERVYPAENVLLSGPASKVAGKAAELGYKGLKSAAKHGRKKLAKYKKQLKFKEGGSVNKAGNYTKPGLRKKIVSQVKAAATHGTKAGQWSARKAQLVAKKYKDAGGGYTD